MFANYKSIEEKSSQQYISEKTIHIKLATLSMFSSQKYYNKFLQAHHEYLDHKKSVFKFRGKLYGPGCFAGNHPYITSMKNRFKRKKLKERDKELLDFLNEEGVGVNTKSLKFHVLVKLFDLNFHEFNNETAEKLIKDTHAILLELYPEAKTSCRNYKR